jgi:tetratricopeptide (TPR) repeat protein
MEGMILVMTIKTIVCNSVGMTLLLIVAAALMMNSCTGVTRVGESKISTPAAELLSDAAQALESGDYDRAELQMERAIRMAPRNGQAWHFMARIRYEQGDYDQTVQFCLKSNTLASHDPSLMKQNWVLLEKAYTMLGETIKAEDARHKADTI